MTERPPGAPFKGPSGELSQRITRKRMQQLMRAHKLHTFLAVGHAPLARRMTALAQEAADGSQL